MNNSGDGSGGKGEGRAADTAPNTPGQTARGVSNAGRPQGRPGGPGRTGRRFNVFRVIGALLSALGLLGAIIGLVKSNQGSALARDERQTTASILKQVVSQAEQISSLRAEVDRLQADIAAAPGSGGDVEAKLGQLNDAVAKLQASVEKVETVILEDPAKAVAIPLLRKDLEGYKENQQVLQTSIRQELDRLYDMNKWLFGTTITLALTVLGAVIGNFFKQAGSGTEGDAEASAPPEVVGGESG